MWEALNESFNALYEANVEELMACTLTALSNKGMVIDKEEGKTSLIDLNALEERITCSRVLKSPLLPSSHLDCLFSAFLSC